MTASFPIPRRPRRLLVAAFVVASLAVALVPVPVCADGPDCAMWRGDGDGAGAVAAPTGCGGGACPLARAATPSTGEAGERSDRQDRAPVPGLSCCPGGDFPEPVPAALAGRTAPELERPTAVDASSPLGPSSSTPLLPSLAAASGLDPGGGASGTGAAGLGAHLALGEIPLYTLLASLLN